MAEIPSHWPKGIKTHEELLAAEMAADPEFAAEWERLALARMVAVQLIGYRADHGLSQRQLAARLGVSQPRIVELESGEKNPQIETLVKVAAATGIEFAIDIAPIGQEPELVGKAVKNTQAHRYAGASVLVAGACAGARGLSSTAP
ncbi:MAG TPA: helix-turn-helix transcriptional regulator [Solirubrobacteraceae bacterium]|nr:helix-turn-helix transcriptional regulator [Solirubrobacteraceae bacterium]